MFSAAIRGGDQGLQIGHTIGRGAQDQDCDPSAPEILLKRDLLIRGDDDVETGVLICPQENSVFPTRETSVSGGLALMASEQQPETLVNTLIKQ